jgi:hypothetical protein
VGPTPLVGPISQAGPTSQCGPSPQRVNSSMEKWEKREMGEEETGKEGKWEKGEMGKGGNGKRRNGKMGKWEKGEMGKGGNGQFFLFYLHTKEVTTLRLGKSTASKNLANHAIILNC